MEKKKKFYVVGTPIKHSKSPIIHQQFAAQFGLTIDYRILEVGRGNLAHFLATARDEDVKGINVTVPLKEEAWRLADESSPRVRSAKAANTLWFEGSKLLADNTDGIGIIKELETNIGFSLRSTKVLIIGAGGAARGILGPLSQKRPSLIMLTNRTIEKSELLAEQYGRDKITILKWGQKISEPADLIINCTSLSLSGKIPNLHENAIGRKTICYDMAYGSGETAFVAWAVNRGAYLAVDGLGMLVEQAAESFKIWHGVEPQTSEVIARLRENIF